MVVALIGLLIALVLPHLGRGLQAARRTACASNLRQMQTAFTLYLDDHNGRWFPWREMVPEGTLWYWGLEPRGGGSEGLRPLDRSRARLAPYLGVGTVETCPTFPYDAPYFKRKFTSPSYGYGLNGFMIAGLGMAERTGVLRAHQVQNPSQVVTWADSIQINTWQAPASPSRPMYEEWYWLSTSAPPSFHFRHGRLLNAAFADGRVEALPPDRLDPRLDGRSGFLDPPGEDRHLRTSR